jgi:hypothetical protein
VGALSVCAQVVDLVNRLLELSEEKAGRPSEFQGTRKVLERLPTSDSAQIGNPQVTKPARGSIKDE